MSGRKILLIDDECGFTSLLKLQLEKGGAYEVFVENDSHKAVDAVREHEPELILMDVMMPGRDGGEVRRDLLSDPRLSRVPLVLLSALFNDEEAHSSETSLADGDLILPKPVETRRLIEVIEELLNRRENNPEAARENPARYGERERSDAGCKGGKRGFRPRIGTAGRRKKYETN